MAVQTNKAVWKDGCKVPGSIKFFNRRRGFGSILDEHGHELFFHVSQIESYAGTTPKRGQKVLYGAVEESPKGRKAQHIFLKEG